MIRTIPRGRGFGRGLLLMAGLGCPWPGMGRDATPRQDATPEGVTVTERDVLLRFVGPRGSSGHPGDPGPEIAVWMDREPEGRRWLRLRVVAAGRTTRYVLDPDRGTLRIQSVGGAGGYGGKGATAGAAGRGGPIRVTMTPEAKPFLDRIHPSSPGGPEPVILEGPWPFAD